MNASDAASPLRGGVARRLVWTGLALASAYAVFIGGSWWGIYQPGLRIISVVLAGAVLLVWLVLYLRDPACDRGRR